MFTERAPQSPARHWRETQQNEESSWKGSLCVAQYRNLLSHLHLWRTQKGNLCAWLMNDLLPASLAAQLSLSGTCKWKVLFNMNIQMRQCKCSRLCIECFFVTQSLRIRLFVWKPPRLSLQQFVNHSHFGQIIGGQTYFLFFIFLFLSSFSPSQVSTSLMFKLKM